MTTVLFIGGVGRSGSTLLEQMLAPVPGVVALGEVVHLWQRSIRDDERCGCGTPFSACGFWQQVGEKAFGGWRNVDVARIHWLRDQVDRVRKVPAMSRRHMTEPVSLARDEYAAYYTAVYEAAAAVSGATVVVDSSKQPSMPHVLAGQPGVDLRLVHAVRDSRAVCYAWTKRVERPDRSGGTVYMDRYPPGAMARTWMAHNLAMDATGSWRAPKVRLRYEDLVASPQVEFGRVLDTIGMVPDSRTMSHVTQDSVAMAPTHTAAGNPLRFATGTIAIRRDDAWKAAMPTRERRLVEAQTWPLLLRYGYLRG